MATKAKPTKTVSRPKAISGNTSAAVTRQAKISTTQFIKAAHSGEAKLLASMVTSDFTWIDETGEQMAMASCVESIEEMVSRPPDELSRLKVESFRMGDLKARSFGDTIIGTMRYTDTVSILDKGSKKPRREKRDMMVTAVWITQGKEQRLAAVHMSSIQ
jgi:hypothetical protein